MPDDLYSTGPRAYFYLCSVFNENKHYLSSYPCWFCNASGERPHWLYAVAREWGNDETYMEAQIQAVTANRLDALSEDVTAAVNFWTCDDYQHQYVV